MEEKHDQNSQLKSVSNLHADSKSKLTRSHEQLPSNQKIVQPLVSQQNVKK